ncbi:MAG TPA: AtpZ/AtpI family protein [Thermoanaerobaculia bacterium]|jgi:hypothetical protein
MSPPGANSRYALVAEATTAGLMFLLGPAAGYFLGKWIGTWLHVGPIPSYVGAALGLVSAFVHLIRLTNRTR